MMIQKLTIENLKCFSEKTEINLAPITLLYGENSGGKSTVLQALSLLKEIYINGKESGLNAIPFRDFVTSKDCSREIAIGFDAVQGHLSDKVCISQNGVSTRSYLSSLKWETRISWDSQSQEPQIGKVSTGETPRYDAYQAQDGLAFHDRIKQDYYTRPEMDELCSYLAENSATIRDGVDRFVEKSIMSEFMNENPDVSAKMVKRLKLLQGKKSCVIFPDYFLAGVDETGMPKASCSKAKEAEIQAERNLQFPVDEIEIEASNEVFMREQEIEAQDTSAAEEYMQKLREGLPEWIKSCPPEWIKYRCSSEFQQKSEEFKKNRYGHLLKFCEAPAPSFFENFDFQLDFLNGDMSRQKETKSLFIDDLLEIAYSPCLELVYHDEGINPSYVTVEIKTDSTPVLDEDKVKLLKNLQLEYQSRIDRDAQVWTDSYTSMVRLLRSSVLISPHRAKAERIYDFLQSSDELPFQLAQNKNDLCKRVSDWLKRLGVDYEVTVRRSDIEGYFQILLQDTRNPELPPVNYADVGFGVSQIFPVLVAGLSGKPSLILIDEPEQHIHPRLQAELGSFFAECIRERGHQFIIATHSEHVLLRIMKLMRLTFDKTLSTGLDPLRCSDVNVLYIERSSNGSVVRAMPLNARGELVKSWPGGFFEEGLKEVF